MGRWRRDPQSPVLTRETEAQRGKGRAYVHSEGGGGVVLRTDGVEGGCVCTC